MSNYIIWKTEYDEVMVEVFNEYDILNIQKQFIEQGYIVISICRGVFDRSTFMKLEKVTKSFDTEAESYFE